MRPKQKVYFGSEGATSNRAEAGIIDIIPGSRASLMQGATESDSKWVFPPNRGLGSCFPEVEVA